jgi:hypothetical protein
MRPRFLGFLFLLMSSLPARAFAGEPSRAGLVIQFDNGRLESHCIAFEGDEISGADLLIRSGLDLSLDASQGMGITVCRIESLGCDFPADHCFCQCMGDGPCAYWTYFYRDPGQADWSYSALGAALRKVKPGAIEAWVWGDGHTPPASNLTFEGICAPATPTRTPTVALPTTLPSTATTAPVETQPLSPSPRLRASPVIPKATVIPPPPTPTPAITTRPHLSGYWPFGLVVLGLAAMGLFARLRRM